MDFSIWTDTGHSEFSRATEGDSSTCDADRFVGLAGEKLGPQMDSDGGAKSKFSSDVTEFSLDTSNPDADGVFCSWNLGSPSLGGAAPDQQQLLWESEFQYADPNNSFDELNGGFGASPFDKDLDPKDAFAAVDSAGAGGLGAEPAKPRAANHKRELSDTFTMRVPLVSRSHNDSYGDAAGRAASMLGFSPDLANSLVQTPVRGGSGGPGGHSFAPDSLVAGSPSCFVNNGLESPLESPALQSPYMAYQPFPMVPPGGAGSAGSAGSAGGPHSAGSGGNAAGQSGMPMGGMAAAAAAAHTPAARKMSGAGSPRSRRKSSSGSQSSMASPLGPDGELKSGNAAAAAAAAPQTPRTRTATGLMKTKHKKASSSVSTTPKVPSTLANETSSAQLSSASSSSTKPSTPLRGSAEAATATNTPTQTPTPAREGKKDGRKRIAKEQIDILEAFFHQNPRPERDDRLRLAAETHLEQRTVQIWFQNRRAKSRSMKMPPSKADTSVLAMQYRAAQAAASNAAAAGAAGAAAHNKNMNMGAPGGAADYDYWSPKNVAPGSGMTSAMQQRHASMDSSSGGGGGGGFSRQMSMAQMSPLNGAMGNNGGPAAGMGGPGMGGPGMAGPGMGGGGGSGSAGSGAGAAAAAAGNGAMNFQMQPQQYGSASHHQRWNSVNVSSPGHSMLGYHQQLPKHGVPQAHGMAAQMQRIQQFQQIEQMQHMQQLQQAQQMQRMQHMPQQQMAPFRGGGASAMPPMNRSQSLSMFEPFMSYRDNSEAEFDAFAPNDMVMGNGPGRSDSLLSLVSMNSGVPPSPMTADSMATFSPDLRSLQNSPELISPMAWPSQLGRAKSSVTLHNNGMDYVAPYSNDSKRRRSLYANAPVPAWNSQYDVDPVGSSRTSPTSMSAGCGTGSNSVAASAAAAALRTRHRSYTQPAARSRQPSIRLQLDESNNAAQLVVLPDDENDDLGLGGGSGSGGSSGSGGHAGNSSGSSGHAGSGASLARGHGPFAEHGSRDMSPGRAERAAERLLAERAAAATVGRPASHLSKTEGTS